MVLQWTSEQGVGVRPVRAGVEAPVLLGLPTEFFRRFMAHSPAWVQLCALSERWSRQKVDLQESQRKGRKSNWRQ